MPAIGTAVATGLLGLEAGSIGAGIVAGVVNIGLSVGLSYVARAVMGKQQTATTGNSGKMSFGGAVGRTFMVGVGMTAGSLLYWGSWGDVGKTPNAYVTFVIALSDLPVTSLEELWVDSVKVTVPDMSGTQPYPQGWPVKEYEKPSGNNHLWIKFYDGNQTAADGFLVDTFGGSTDRPWADTAVLKGVSYAVVTCQEDPKLFSGFPKFNFVLKGIPVYSIREDSTNGGSGSQRWSDPTTWAWSENAADITYTVLRGLSYGGNWFYGLQNISANRLPYTEWAAAANKADVSITNADGSTEAQYRCGGEIPVGTKLVDTLNDLLTSQNGRLSEAGGIYKLHNGEAGSSVLSFSDDDILSTEDQTFDPIISLGDKINGLTAKYPEPNQMWALYDAPPLYNSDYEAQDGNRRLVTDVTYNLVPYQRQVQRLMKSAVAEHRRARKHTLMLPPWAYVLEPGDVIDWTSARNGYDAKLFRVDQVADQPNCDIQVQITEVDPSDYDWNAATDEKPVSYGTLTINVPSPQVMAGWSASGATVNDPDGTARRPAIQLFYEGDLTGVAYVQAQVRYPGATDLLFTGQTPYGDPSTNAASESVLISFASILPNVEYEVRGRYAPTAPRDSLWSNESLDGSGNVVEGPWLAVTTPDVRLGAKDIYPITQSQLDQTIKDIQTFTQDGARAAIAAIQALEKLVADHSAAGYDNTQQVRVELTAATDYSVAKATDLFTVASNATSAVAARTTTLEASMTTVQNGLALKADASTVSALSSTVSNQGTAITANSDAITQTNATVGKFSASGLSRIYAAATNSGASATVAFGATASSGAGNPTIAAFYADAMSDGSSRLVLLANQTLIMDSSGNLAAMFQAGTTYLNTAVIGDATITSSKVCDAEYEWLEVA